MTVSPERRQYAAQLDADCARLENIGTVAAGKIGRKVRMAALQAYRAGNDPSGAIREPLGDMAPLLADAMVAAWLTARWRVLKTVEAHQAKTVKLSTAYDNAIQALKAQMHVGDLSIDQLRDAFVPDVLAKLHDMNRATQGRITTKMLELTQRQAHVTEGIRELQGVFTAAGITPENSYTLENIFRTQTQLAYGAGRWAALHEPEIDDILWGFEYSTVGDDRVRSSHAAMDGVRLPKDHSFWQTNWPPNGWSCRCQALEIFEGDDLAKESKIILPAPKTVDGVTFQPEADRGFGFNPGQSYNVPKIEPLPIKPVAPADKPIPVVPKLVVQETPVAPVAPEKPKTKPAPKKTVEPKADPKPQQPKETPKPIKKPDTASKPVEKTEVVAKPVLPKPKVDLQHAENLVNIAPRSKNTKPIKDAMDAINSVHGVPKGMKALDVKDTNSSIYGQYVFGEYTGSPFQFKLTTKGNRQGFAMLHEMGHYLDHHGIGTPGKFDSETGGQTSVVLEQIKKSKAYAKLQAKRAEYVAAKDKTMIKHLNYLLDDNELFARGYSQHIAIKSKNAKILEELNEWRVRKDVAYQWDDLGWSK
jgi:SPP1 gp7 family putative phage head morphogenesis protein